MIEAEVMIPNPPTMYYLSHREEIDAYVRRRDEETDEALEALKANLTPAARALRTRLRAFRDQCTSQS